MVKQRCAVNAHHVRSSWQQWVRHGAYESPRCPTMECNESPRCRFMLINNYNSNYIIYKHNPPHLFLPSATYMITSSTYRRKKFFHNDELKALLLTSILYSFTKFSWRIKAYVILANHYHILATAPDQRTMLPKIISNIHRYTAHACNKMHQTPGTKIWWNYWDTCISYEGSYFARLNYIHFNPIKHGHVSNPEEWKFSSHNEFHKSNCAQALKIEKDFPFDKIKVYDDF